MLCEISQPKLGPCENGHLLRNDFAALGARCEIEGWLRKWTSAAKRFRSPTHPSTKIFAAAKPPLGTRVPFHSTVTPFRSCEMAAKSPKHQIFNFHNDSLISQHSGPISQLRNGLRKGASSTKMPFRCEIRPRLRKLKRLLASYF